MINALTEHIRRVLETTFGPAFESNPAYQAWRSQTECQPLWMAIADLNEKFSLQESDVPQQTTDMPADPAH